MLHRLELRSIEARRFTKAFEKPPAGQIRIDHNSTVNLMEIMEEGQAKVEFAYTTSYGALGVVKIEGAMVWEDPQEQIEPVVKEWSETRKMPNEVASMIHSMVMQACVPEAVGLAKNLRLPPPIPLPQVRFGDKQAGGKQAVAKSTAPSGPEFA